MSLLETVSAPGGPGRLGEQPGQLAGELRCRFHTHQISGAVAHHPAAGGVAGWARAGGGGGALPAATLQHLSAGAPTRADRWLPRRHPPRVAVPHA